MSKGGDIGLFTGQAIVFAVSLLLGAHLGGWAVGACGGAGIAILGFFFNVSSVRESGISYAPFDVIEIILCVVTLIACLQTAGGLDFMIYACERAIRRYPKAITFIAPIVTFFLTVLAGTGHSAFSVLSVIAEVSKEAGVRPSKPLSIAVIASQLAICASPIAAAVVALEALGTDEEYTAETGGLTLAKILAVSLPSTFIGTMVGAVVAHFWGCELKDDAEFLRRLKTGECTLSRPELYLSSADLKLRRDNIARRLRGQEADEGGDGKGGGDGDDEHMSKGGDLVLSEKERDMSMLTDTDILYSRLSRMETQVDAGQEVDITQREFYKPASANALSQTESSNNIVKGEFEDGGDGANEAGPEAGTLVERRKRWKERPEAKAGARTSVLIFLVAILIIVVWSFLVSSKYKSRRLKGADAISAIMLTACVVVILVCPISVNAVPNQPTFKSGAVAAICVLGLGWEGSMFIGSWEKQIASVAKDILTTQSWLLSVIAFVTGTLLYSQTVTTKVILSIAFQLRMTPKSIVAAFPTTAALFVLPTYPTVIAAAELDDTGTTRLSGRKVPLFGHPFCVPGIVAIVVAVAVGYGLGEAVF